MNNVVTSVSIKKIALSGCFMAWSTVVFSLPSWDEVKKTARVQADKLSVTVSTKAQETREYVQTPEFASTMGSAGKLAYNASKLYMVKVLCTRVLAESFDTLKNSSYSEMPGNLAWIGVCALSSYALLESAYRSYFPPIVDSVADTKTEHGVATGLLDEDAQGDDEESDFKDEDAA